MVRYKNCTANKEIQNYLNEIESLTTNTEIPPSTSCTYVDSLEAITQCSSVEIFQVQIVCPGVCVNIEVISITNKK